MENRENSDWLGASIKEFNNTISIEMPTTKEEVDRKLVMSALDYNKGNRTRTATMLNVGVRSLQRWIDKYRKQGHFIK